ncbi:MAG: hypothetical protein ABGX71_03225 [Methyloprofundus sp.]|uniref:hypothetical protein n=1 Tax=Methyloprofundus sp. TaxID=2020875 RepID=UPI00260F7D83|nr:hypothetical protein [Methyloprofundus sp.]
MKHYDPHNVAIIFLNLDDTANGCIEKSGHTIEELKRCEIVHVVVGFDGDEEVTMKNDKLSREISELLACD